MRKFLLFVVLVAAVALARGAAADLLLTGVGGASSGTAGCSNSFDLSQACNSGNVILLFGGL